MQFFLSLAMLTTVFGPLASPAIAAEKPLPVSVPIGGALRADNDVVWGRLVELAGGPGARFVVLATAAENPERSAASIVAALNRRGAIAEHLRVAPRLAEVELKAAVRDPDNLAKVKAANGVYFSGGTQERITQTLYEADGSPTPLLTAIRELHQRGGVVAGTSAGAAIMSRTMFRDAQDVLGVLRNGVKEGKEIDRGLDFVGPDVFIDQHFLKRGRFGRMLRAMSDLGYKLGVGVDENSAAIFRGDEVEVLGYMGALVIDLHDAISDPELPAFNIRSVRLSYLDNGDRYNLRTRRLIPSPEKQKGAVIDPNSENFKPYYHRQIFYPDILGDTSVVNLMSNLLDNQHREALGLAFGTDQPEAFEFRFRKGRDSLGYLNMSGGNANYSVANIYLDVTPVMIKMPLYEPRSSQ